MGPRGKDAWRVRQPTLAVQEGLQATSAWSQTHLVCHTLKFGLLERVVLVRRTIRSVFLVIVVNLYEIAVFIKSWRILMYDVALVSGMIDSLRTT